MVVVLHVVLEGHAPHHEEVVSAQLAGVTDVEDVEEHLLVQALLLVEEGVHQVDVLAAAEKEGVEAFAIQEIKQPINNDPRIPLSEDMHYLLFASF